MITRNMTEQELVEYCNEIFREQSESGLTVNQLCKENGIPRAGIRDAFTKQQQNRRRRLQKTEGLQTDAKS